MSIHAFLNQCMRKLGLNVSRYHPLYDPSARKMALLKECNIDVGASQGQFAQRLRSQGYKNRIVSFEPLAAEFGKLEEKARDDSTWQVVPVWQNKLQAMAYEDAMYTRISHYSFDIRDNRLRLFPTPSGVDFSKVWFEFTVDEDPLLDKAGMDTGAKGVNNMNTAPFANIPYNNINSIGKQWIRRFALSVCKEMLGVIRSKFATIPIPGESELIVPGSMPIA